MSKCAKWDPKRNSFWVWCEVNIILAFNTSGMAGFFGIPLGESNLNIICYIFEIIVINKERGLFYDCALEMSNKKYVEESCNLKWILFLMSVDFAEMQKCAGWIEEGRNIEQIIQLQDRENWFVLHSIFFV